MQKTIDCLTLEQAADQLGVSVGRVQQLLREGVLVVMQRDGAPSIPAEFIDGNQVVKGLSGALQLLRDAGYSDEEAIGWLFTPDESLPGSPITALRENRGKEVRRRAQATGF